MLCLAKDLVAEADYVAAAADWEERHARLRGLQDELSAGGGRSAHAETRCGPRLRICGCAAGPAGNKLQRCICSWPPRNGGGGHRFAL